MGLHRKNKITVPNNSGFTIVELSIVLVIIAFLIAGIIGGKSLLRNSKITDMSVEAQSFKAKIAQFEDKYQALPGDFSHAKDIWEEADNGDGNSKIELKNLHSVNESYNAWEQLSLANITKEKYTGTSTPEGTMDGTNFDLDFATHYYQQGNIIKFSKRDGGKTGTSALTPFEALALDKKLDDGRPGRGDIIAKSGNDTPNTSCVTDETDENTIYLEHDADAKCQLYFWLERSPVHRCPTSDETYSEEDGKCIPICLANKVYEGGLCVCPVGTFTDGDKCLQCPIGETYDPISKTCGICPPSAPHLDVNGNCIACIAPEVFDPVSGTCVSKNCEPTIALGEASHLYGQPTTKYTYTDGPKTVYLHTFNSGEEICLTHGTPHDSANPSTGINTSSCTCSPVGKRVENTICEAPNKTDTNGYCHAPCVAPAAWDELARECVCPIKLDKTGHYLRDESCLYCTTATESFSPSLQQCLACASFDGNQCVTCDITQGLKWNATLNSCESICTNGQTWQNGACSCPAGENDTGAGCVSCPAWEDWDTSSSSCQPLCTGTNVVYRGGWANNSAGCVCITGASPVDINGESSRKGSILIKNGTERLYSPNLVCAKRTTECTKLFENNGTSYYANHPDSNYYIAVNGQYCAQLLRKDNSGFQLAHGSLDMDSCSCKAGNGGGPSECYEQTPSGGLTPVACPADGQCINGAGWNGGQCTCPDGEFFDTVLNMCRTTCPDGQIFDANGAGCTCPRRNSGYDTVNKICIACTPDTRFDTNTNQCEARCSEPNQIWESNSCKCVSGYTYDIQAKECVPVVDNCEPHQKLENNVCVDRCNEGTWDGSTCICPTGQSYNEPAGTCDCVDANSYKDSQGTCVTCNVFAGDMWNPQSFACETQCGGEQKWDAGAQACYCPKGSNKLGKDCIVCDTAIGYVWDGTQCTAPVAGCWVEYHGRNTYQIHNGDKRSSKVSFNKRSQAAAQLGCLYTEADTCTSMHLFDNPNHSIIISSTCPFVTPIYNPLSCPPTKKLGRFGKCVNANCPEGEVWNPNLYGGQCPPYNPTCACQPTEDKCDGANTWYPASESCVQTCAGENTIFTGFDCVCKVGFVSDGSGTNCIPE